MVPVLKEASQETNDIMKDVVEESKFYLQALIVKITKAKKSQTHKDLEYNVILSAPQGPHINSRPLPA